MVERADIEAKARQIEQALVETKESAQQKAVVVAVAIVYYFPQVPRDEWPIRVAMGLEFGGAVGNLFDRLTIGWVTDFISIWKFPVFNATHHQLKHVSRVQSGRKKSDLEGQWRVVHQGQAACQS